MKTGQITILVFLMTLFKANCQTTALTYDLIVSDKSIGTVKTSKTIDGNTITYTSNTDATLSFIIDTNIKTRMTTVYKNDSLLSSDYKFYKNNKLKEFATIVIKGGKYIFNHDGKTTEINEGIRLSTILLPFEIPKHNSVYFEEVEGHFKTIKSINKYSFKLTNPNNNSKDDYIYKNGIMEQCIVRNPFIDFTMVLLD
ncbi:MAG: hypothetical protein CMC14_09115 [Flavobacteriaceae bacterium]|nr:hypothetical protein [Flavobacteriaceae bacterium]|tara:strand:- start:146 stop:739 length:594 start_codon:yes stop_codon:yes gene_type:complete